MEEKVLTNSSKAKEGKALTAGSKEMEEKVQQRQAMEENIQTNSSKAKEKKLGLLVAR